MRFDLDGRYPVVTSDVVYAAPDGQELLARVYRPSEQSGALLPALVDVHGGAWTHFDRHADVYFDAALAASGMVVVALDFRQAPTHRYPTAVCDVLAGVRYVKSHASELGIDTAKLGLIGGSSGGHLVLLAALRPNAAEYAATKPVGAAGEIDASVAFALPLWPICDPLERYRYVLRRQDEPPAAGRDRMFFPAALIAGHHGFFADEAAMERASAVRIVAAGEAEHLPPLWICQPELDENVTIPMTQRFADAYRRAGGSVDLVIFNGVGHSFANFPGPAADDCIMHMRRFIQHQQNAPSSM